VSPKRISELEKARRRRELIVAAATVWFTWVFLIVLYYALPIKSRSDAAAYVRLGASATVFALAIAWQTRRIVKAELPELRAVEALGVAVALFLIFFSTVYLALANASGRNFSQDLDHTKALYFTITVFSTVGFGDITPTKDPARLMVAIQMLLDLVFIGVGIRMLFNVAQHGLLETAEEAEAEGA
jgi:hypothetical protein